MTDLVRTTFTGGPSGDWLTLFHIDRLLGGNVQDSIDIVRDFWNAASAMIHQTVTMHVDGSCDVLDPLTGQPTGVDQGTGRTVAGARNGDVLPYQTQGLIYWNTGTWINGRQVRGRTFIPAVAEDQNDGNGLPNSSALSTMAAAAAVLVSPTTGQPVIWSRTHHNMYPIASASIQGKWAIMRTRR
jgi:hypothetical protein